MFPAQAQRQEPNNEEEDYEDEDDLPEEQNAAEEYPIRTDTQLDNKIASSHADNSYVFLTPKIVRQRVVFPLLDAQKKIVYKKMRIGGVEQDTPVVRVIKHMDVFLGYEKREESFPIPKWFNDSIPTSILSLDEARYIRRLDDLGIKLGRRMLSNPDKLQILGFVHRLYSQKMSIADSAKGIEGGVIDKIKTNTHKSESLFRKDMEAMRDFKMRQETQNRGLLGMGFDIPLIGIRV